MAFQAVGQGVQSFLSSAPDSRLDPVTLVSEPAQVRGRGLGSGVRGGLTLPLGRWQALRAASTRLRSAGNIWKKLKEQRKAPGKERGQAWKGKALGSWSEVGEELGRLTSSQGSSLQG